MLPCPTWPPAAMRRPQHPGKRSTRAGSYRTEIERVRGVRYWSMCSGFSGFATSVLLLCRQVFNCA